MAEEFSTLDKGLDIPKTYPPKVLAVGSPRVPVRRPVHYWWHRSWLYRFWKERKKFGFFPFQGPPNVGRVVGEGNEEVAGRLKEGRPYDIAEGSRAWRAASCGSALHRHWQGLEVRRV